MTANSSTERTGTLKGNGSPILQEVIIGFRKSSEILHVMKKSIKLSISSVGMLFDFGERTSKKTLMAAFKL